MKAKFRMIFIGLAVAAFAGYGCSEKADTGKPVEQIKREAQGMSLSELESNAKTYANEIKAKKAELEKTAAPLKMLSAADFFGDKAKDIKSQLSKIQSEVSALTERYQLYAQKYQEAGGDVSKIKIA